MNISEVSITFRVRGYWLGPLITVWSTHTKEEFDKYCNEQGFIKEQDGIYRTKPNCSGHKSYLEIK